MQKAFSADVGNQDGTFYTIEKPECLSDNPKLLVMFSSIADFPLNASIERRMFFKNFQSISKYIPKDTFILRIADIGGVVGSFYFDTVFDSEIESRISSVIEKVRISHNISRENTVLYGASKGGTAALYHGSKLSLRALAVDPIVSDDYYVEKLNDAHFVEGIYLQSKAEKFSAEGGFKPKEPKLLHVITSQNSEQFTYVSNLLSKNIDINSYVFSNPLIAGHTDVAKNTINLTTSLINLLLYGQAPYLKINTIY